MSGIEGRITGLTAWDVALVQRVRRGGSVLPEEWLRFARDLDAWPEVDEVDEDVENDDEDLPPIRCDGSVCCPCGRCDGLEHC
jgi:hypothetical protein